MTIFNRVKGSGNINTSGGAVEQYAKYKTSRTESSYSNSSRDAQLFALLSASNSDELSAEEKEAYRLANESKKQEIIAQKLQNLQLGITATAEGIKLVGQVSSVIGGLFANSSSGSSAAPDVSGSDVSNVTSAAKNSADALQKAMADYEKTGDYESLKSAISDAKSNKSKCETTLANLNNSAAVAAQEGVLKTATEELDKKNEALTTANSEYDEAVKNRDDYEKGEYAQIKEKYEAQKTAVSKAEADLETKTQALKDAEQAETTAIETQTTAQKAFDDASAAVTEKAQEKAKANTALVNAVAAANSARASYNAIMSNPNATPEQKATAATNLKNAEKAEKDAKKALNDAEKAEKEAEKAKAKAEKTLEDAKEAVTKATEAKETAQTAKTDAEKALADAKTAFEEIGNKMKEAQTNLDGLKATVCTKESARDKAAMEKDQAKLDKEQAEKDLKDTKKEVEKQKKQVQKDLASIDATIEKAEQQASYRNAGSKKS